MSEHELSTESVSLLFTDMKSWVEYDGKQEHGKPAAMNQDFNRTQTYSVVRPSYSSPLSSPESMLDLFPSTEDVWKDCI